MAPRAYWKGYLKLFLVSCPVRMFAATTSTNKVSFHLLHKDTHNRIQMKPHDPELGVVERSDLVKGYEFEKGRYLVVENEELEKIQAGASKTITISNFVDSEEVDSLYLDSPYYVAPDGAVANEAYSVIVEAMRRKQRSAIARVVLASRERQVLLSVRGKGLVMTTLRTASEVRDAEAYFEDIEPGEMDVEMIQIAEQIIDQKSAAFDPAGFEDAYQKSLVELVQAKLKGQEPVLAQPAQTGNVINLMDALRRSLDEKPGMKPPAKSKSRAPAKAKQPAAPRRKSRKSG